jgi:uncharacterized protein YoxC
MTDLVCFRSLVAAAVLIAASAACTKKSETRQEADRAAENVTERVEDLKEESRELAETAKERADDINAIDEVRRPAPVAPGRVDVPELITRQGDDDEERNADVVEDISDEAKDVGESARELEEATSEFRHRRMVRVGTLRAVHSVAASQPMLINAISQSFSLAPNDRAEVQEKLTIFQMRLDEAGNAIQSLELVEARDWESRNDAASKAIERVEDARDQVWEALEEADRIDDRTSMR